MVVPRPYSRIPAARAARAAISWARDVTRIPADVSTQQTDEQAFRDHAREAALSQIAMMLVEFQGLRDYGLRFDIVAMDKLRVQLAQTLATFIEETPVESAHPE